jgi:hypothetical protein
MKMVRDIKGFAKRGTCYLFLLHDRKYGARHVKLFGHRESTLFFPRYIQRRKKAFSGTLPHAVSDTFPVLQSYSIPFGTIILRKIKHQHVYGVWGFWVLLHFLLDHF